MSYHTTVIKSYDFYSSLEKAREIADDVKAMLRKKDPSAEFFPYRSVEEKKFFFSSEFPINSSFLPRHSSIFYVYYEQYLTIWKDSLFSVMTSLGAIFVVSFLLTGCDLIAALIILIMVALIVINMMGMMWLWNISLNAISLVNLVVVSIESLKSKCATKKSKFMIYNLNFPSSVSQLESVLNSYRTSYEHIAKQKAQMKCEPVKHWQILAAAYFQASH